MISCRQPLVYLREATEIKVNYCDIDRLKDFVTEDWICKADIVIYLPRNQIINWESIDVYKNVLNITIAVEDTGQIEMVRRKKYKVFWAYAVSSFWELQSLLELKVNQVLLDAPLYFDLPKVKQICGKKVELRAVVNKCFNDHLPHKDGVCGTYIRPEDIEFYSNFISHFEFDIDTLSKEYTLYEIYTKDKQWPGNLNILLTNFNVDVDNRGLSMLLDENDEEDPDLFARIRCICGQKCQQGFDCDFCHTNVELINLIQKKIEDGTLIVEED